MWETHLLVKEAAKVEPVRAFLAELTDQYPVGKMFTGAELMAFLLGEEGATAPRMRRILEVARNSTFHYPKVNDSVFVRTLRDLSDETGEVTCGKHMPSYRADFADEVMLRFGLRALDPPLPESYADLLTALTDTVTAIVHLGQLAIDLRLQTSTSATHQQLPARE